MQNRPKELWTGGDMIQLEKTQEALELLGLDVSFNGQPLFTPALYLQTFDIVHLWNFSMEWTRYQVWAATKHKRKIVCSMIYHETDKFISYDDQQIMIDACHAFIFLSQGELERAKRHLQIPEDKIHIVENGIDTSWFNKPDKNKHGDYVLTVGRIEDAKGQLATSKACKNLGIQYICAGQIMDEKIAKSIQDNGGILFGNASPDELRTLYAHAQCVVLASMHEIFPLCVMEAGAQGTNIVLTKGSEWKDIPGVELCTFNNVASIQKAIEKSILKPKNKAFQKKLKEMTWESVAKRINNIYNNI